MQYIIYLDKITLAQAYHNFASFIWIITIAKISQCSSPLFKECWCFWSLDAVWSKWNLLSLQLAYKQVPSCTLASFFLQFVPPFVLIKDYGSMLDNVVLWKTCLSGALFSPKLKTACSLVRSFIMYKHILLHLKTPRNRRTTNWKKNSWTTHKKQVTSPPKNISIKHISENLISWSGTFLLLHISLSLLWLFKCLFSAKWFVIGLEN